MSDNVYSISEIVGTSHESIEDAVRTALERASRTLRNLDWFEVAEIRGNIGDNGAIDHFQITLKVGFRME
jgi:flavin-binding protein dodecin